MDAPLLKAARTGNLELVKLMEEVKGTEIFHQTTHNQNTALHMAARFGHLDLVEYIIGRDYSRVLCGNVNGETPVHIAARAGHEAVVKVLMKHVSQFSKVYVARVKDKSGNTPLHGAVRHNRLQVVKMLTLEDGDSLLLVNDAGESPLSIAIDQRLSAMSKYILGRKPATINYIGPNGQTPLHFAVLGQDSGVMLKILEAKADLVRSLDENKRNPLHYAAAYGFLDMVEQLLEVDYSTAYQRDHNGHAPVHLAAKQDHLTVLKALLHHCPDTVELIDNKQRNILHIAAESGNLRIVSHILRLPEIDDLVNSPDSDGNTPLHLGAKNFHNDIVYALSRERSVEIRVTNKMNQTALAIAQSSADRGMELQQHLTVKALKKANKDRAVNPEEILQEETESEKTEVERGKKTREMAQTLSVIATLIATFTFAAAFTLPGGFVANQDNNNNTTAVASGKQAHEGMAVLVRNSAFKAFVISDATAMTSSICATVLIMWSSAHRDCESLMDNLPYAMLLTWVALVAMTLAFVTGLVAVISDVLWLAIAVCVIACLLPAIFYFVAPFVQLLALKSDKPTNRRYSAIENNPFVFFNRLMRLELAAAFRSLCRRATECVDCRQWSRKNKSAGEV